MHFNQYSDCLYDIGLLNFNQPIRGKNNVSNYLNYIMGNGGVSMKTECKMCEGKGYYNLSSAYDDIHSRVSCECGQHNEQDHEWNTTCQSWGELALWFLIIGQVIFVGLLFLFIGGE